MHAGFHACKPKETERGDTKSIPGNCQISSRKNQGRKVVGKSQNHGQGAGSAPQVTLSPSSEALPVLGQQRGDEFLGLPGGVPAEIFPRQHPEMQPRAKGGCKYLWQLLLLYLTPLSKHVWGLTIGFIFCSEFKYMFSSTPPNLRVPRVSAIGK